ncbi:alpha/beta fold hydrolase [Silvibacterium acidisoli]|uniref:alpha/beta fold hydrolase n=1 Tax=Acidobacteriaceae bacterium ZG23-2 TaxID=2883246 RepID=UPI00406C1FB2
MNENKNVFVLVHGGWHGGWCWRRVADQLRMKGHDVFTPTLTGSGERAHLMSSGITMQTGIEDVVGVLEAEELEHVTLVGHSAGAAVVAGVADRIPERIASLIWLDGLILKDGESLRTYFTETQEAIFQAGLEAGGIPFPAPPPQGFGVPTGADADWLERRLTPQPFGTASSALQIRSPLGNGLPCTYIACVNPPHPFVAASHSFAQAQSHWRWREISACHDAMITDPVMVADALHQLA